MSQPSSIVRQRGVSLLEALIAILIFSVGILAIVALQATAIKATSDAKYRADAAYLASQIISRMWVDRANLAAYQHRPAGAACAPTGNAATAAAATAWLATVTGTLPGAVANDQQVIVTTDPVTNVASVTVSLCWTAGGERRQHTVTTQIAFGA